MQSALLSLIHRIVVYIVLVSVLQGLILREEYVKYFRFISGMILIILVCSPVLSFFTHENKLYDFVDRQLFSEQREEVKENLSGTDDWYQKSVEQECDRQIKKVLQNMAKEMGFQIVSVKVTWKRKGTMAVKKIEIIGENNVQGKKALTKNKKRIADFKKQTAEKFELDQKAVCLWFTKK